MDASQQTRFAIEALKAGRTQEAEKLLIAAIKKSDSNLDAKYNLSLLYLKSGRAHLAEPLIMDCAVASPSLQVVWTLVDILEASKKNEAAIATLEDILATVPQDAYAHFRLGKLLLSDQPKIAIAHFKAAWDLKPSAEHGVNYVQAAFASEPRAAEHVMDKLLADLSPDDPALLYVFINLLPYIEFGRRENKGLPAHHALSLDEQFFWLSSDVFTRYLELATRLAQKAPDEKWLQLELAIASFCARDYARMNEQIQRAAITNGLWSITRFDKPFMDTILQVDPSNWEMKLPRVTIERLETFNDENITYMACDTRYFFSFALPMMRSLSAVSPGAQVHFHLYDINKQQAQIAITRLEEMSLHFSISSEQTGHADNPENARNYYHSIRFPRL